MKFDIRGFHNNRIWTNLEIDLRNMPENTDFEIKLPRLKVLGVNLFEVKKVTPILRRKEYLTEKFHRVQPFILNKKILTKDLKRFKIQPRRIGKFERLMLKPGEIIKTAATVTLPKNVKGDQFTFSIKQKVDNILLGQINYVIHTNTK